MHIRQVKTGARAVGGGSYTSYRLVTSVHVGEQVKQRTLLNLGDHYPIDKKHWSVLCQRVEQLLAVRGKTEPLVSLKLPPALEREAERLYQQLVPLHAAATDCQSVNTKRLESCQPRSVGVEHVGLWATGELGLDRLLDHLGFNAKADALASIVARLARPASELDTYGWLCEHSAMGELLDVDFTRRSHMCLYRAADALYQHRQVIEDHLYQQAVSRLDLKPTITLFNLTNIYFEGRTAQQSKSQRGRAKEQRSDGPLLTLGLVLDGSGFVRRSQVFEGHVSEGTTLQTMLRGLQTPTEALVVMAGGVATAANLAWLRQEGYHYIVVSRARRKSFDASTAIKICSHAGADIELCRSVDDATGGLLIGCRSPGKIKKEQTINTRVKQRFENELRALHQGLSKPRARRRETDVWRRIGRLQEQSHGVAQHYDIQVTVDPATSRVSAVTWQYRPQPDTRATPSGVYALRSNLTDWDDETLWHTYTMLTDLAAVFRCLKSELGLRPNDHHTEVRAEGHLFITVLAYQLVQYIRVKLRDAGDRRNWRTLRDVLEKHTRLTTVLPHEDGRTTHIRQSSTPEPKQRAIYEALGISPVAGKKHRLTV